MDGWGVSCDVVGCRRRSKKPTADSCSRATSAPRAAQPSSSSCSASRAPCLSVWVWACRIRAQAWTCKALPGRAGCWAVAVTAVKRRWRLVRAGAVGAAGTRGTCERMGMAGWWTV
eukprot:1136702-Pelagomonas_calceolata.AAC.2